MKATTDELKAAFNRTGLRRLGWSFKEAISTPALYTGLNAAAVATNKKLDASGNTAPKQLDLIEGI